MQATDSMPYHEARVLVLIDGFTGSGGKIDGLTKVAKLDFLLRYPTFAERLANSRGIAVPSGIAPSVSETMAVESKMVRYKYGPWDDRYYPVLGRLIGLGLIESLLGQGRLALRITEEGRTLATTLRHAGWEQTWQRARFLKRHFDRTGSALKDMIYAELPEVVDRPLRSIIP
jgi:hypothetical protein